MHGGRHIAQTKHRDFGFFWKEFIAIKNQTSTNDESIKKTECEGLEKVIVGDD